MRYRNQLRTLAAGVVAGVAAIASYSHMRDLAAEHGQPEYLARLLPISVDGLLVVASIVMTEDREAGRPARPWARASFVIGVVASVAANIAAAPEDAISRIISAWPAVALLFVVEMLIGKRKPSTEPAYVPGDTTAAPTPPAEPATTVPELTPGPIPEAVEPVKVKPTRKPRADRTANRVRKAAAEMPPDSTVAEVAAKAKVSETTARRHLASSQPQAPLTVDTTAITDAEMAAATGSDGHRGST